MATKRAEQAETETETVIADEIDSLISVIARDIAEGRRSGALLGLVGVRSRGVPIAERIAAKLKQSFGLDAPVGAVDITLYRDDLDLKARWPVLKGTEIPFDVEGADLVLIDDVLYTGRTIRAALGAICDLGRPARVRLAVLVDRGRRELPIQADIAALTLSAGAEQRVLVRVAEIDQVDRIVRVGE